MHNLLDALIKKYQRIVQEYYDQDAREGLPGGGSYNREITAYQSILADLKAARSKIL